MINSLNPAFQYFTIPGIGGSGDSHWHTHWEQENQNITRVEQLNWDTPSFAEWSKTLSIFLNKATKPVVLIAHSLGCVLIAKMAADNMLPPLKGAFLVAPCDINKANFPSEVVGFQPMPAQPLPCPSLLVYSETDEWCSCDAAINMANAWNAEPIKVGNKGHICGAPEFQKWDAGQKLLHTFVNSIL